MGGARIRTVDVHTEGEPLRVVLEGYPSVEGSNVLEYRRFVAENLDHLRRALMGEPRGHADMYGCLILPPVTQGADFSVVFMHNEGYSTMCGHGIIGVTRVAIEYGLVENTGSVVDVEIDAPAGRVSAHARMTGDRLDSVYFENVPSFIYKLGHEVDVAGLGTVTCDIAFGGAFYAYVDAEALGVGLTPASVTELIQIGTRIKHAVSESLSIDHPSAADLGYLYGTIFVGPPHDASNHSRNVCIFAEGEVDRSPTGTGVSGRLAIHHARDGLRPGERICVESVIGSSFSGIIMKETIFGGHTAIIPRIEGTTFITGEHTFILDPNDPFRHGFFLR
jgi:trans-L-3-hydroxyproline dehydratase